MKVRRPIMRYHGGKWLLAEWVIAHFPVHRVYTEAFGGAASILMRKPRSYAEVYNDLDSEIVNVFRVLQEPGTAVQLRDLVRMTPFSRDEFVKSYESATDSVERARRVIIRSIMGFGSASANREHRTGFRANAHRSGTTPARDWTTWPDQIPAFIERLRGVVIENRPAAEVLEQHDSPETFHYIDPPYPFSTRSLPRGAVQPFCYRHEMTDDQHGELAEVVRGLAGMVVLSGYPCDLYDIDLYPDWPKVDRLAFADGARKRVERLWLSPSTAKALDRDSIFGMREDLVL